MVGVAGVKEEALVQIIFGDPGVNAAARIAIRAGGGSPQMDFFAGDELFDHMGAAVVFVVIGYLRSADISIHRGDAGVGGHIVEPDALHFNGRLAVAEV